MIILLLFSFIAGLITILSPCNLPILPILLSPTAADEKYKPIGIICGVIASFSFFTLAMTSIVQATGVSPDIFRYIAVGIIIFFGCTMLFSPLEQFFTRLTVRITHLGSLLQTESTTKKGFFSFFPRCI